MQIRVDQMDLVGAMIADLGTPALPGRLAAYLRSVATYSYTVIFGYAGPSRPLDLFDDFPEGKRRVFVTDYQDGPYMLDPFFLAATRPVARGLYRMRDLAPDRFYQGEYFRSYYVRTGLAEEIGFFVDIDPATTIVVSLMRADRPFSPREVRALEAVRPVVEATVRQHWAGLGRQLRDKAPARSVTMDARIAHSFQSFGEGILTQREREVVEYTLKGHSAEAIGQALGISPGTVRIHRRNIYAKLRINSQGELFSLFIAAIGGEDGGKAAGQGLG